MLTLKDVPHCKVHFVCDHHQCSILLHLVALADDPKHQDLASPATKESLSRTTFADRELWNSHVFCVRHTIQACSPKTLILCS